MAPHSSPLAGKIPWTEEPGGPQSMGSWTVGHEWATSLSLFTFMHWRRKWQPTPVQCSCLENPRDRGAWWAAVYGVTQSRTRLKRLSSSRRNSRTLQPYAPRGQVTFFSSKLGRKLGIDLCNENTWICVARVRCITFKEGKRNVIQGEKKKS